MFKERLRRRFHDILGDATGPVSVESLLTALYDAISSTIVNRAWPEIFDKCGISYRQLAVSDFLNRHLVWPAHLVWALDGMPLPDADVAAPPEGWLPIFTNWSIRELYAPWHIATDVPSGLGAAQLTRTTSRGLACSRHALIVRRWHHRKASVKHCKKRAK